MTTNGYVDADNELGLAPNQFSVHVVAFVFPPLTEIDIVPSWPPKHETSVIVSLIVIGLGSNIVIVSKPYFL